METYRPEQAPHEAITLSADELREYIFVDNEINERFLPTESGGVFKYFFPSDLSNPFRGKTYYQLSSEAEVIAGLSELEVDPHKPNNLWIKFISVDPTYQGKGHAKQLAQAIVKFAKKRDCTLEHSSFSEEGEARIYGLIDSIAKEHGVTVVNPVELRPN